jgi:hypothetical protein
VGIGALVGRLQRLACSSLLAGWRQVVELMLELPSRLAREGASHGLACPRRTRR